jgi:hypothetical protein
MNKRDVPEDKAGPTTETPTIRRNDAAATSTPKLPLPTDDDTEGQGGKVFGIEESIAEGSARD